MDLFDDLNWRHTKQLMSGFGAWPFESRTKRVILGSIGFLMLYSIYIPETMKLIVYRHDLLTLVECLPVYLVHSMSQIKMINCYRNVELVKNLLIQVRQDWESDLDQDEIKILRDDGNKLKAIMDVYISCLFVVILLFMFIPMIPVILNYTFPLNESRPMIYIFQAEYFVDQDKYFPIIYIFSFLAAYIIPTVFLAFDSLYAGCIQHACSMLVILGRRIKNLNENESKINIGDNDNSESLITLIKRHQLVLQFVKKIEINFTNYLLILLGIIVIGISFTGFQTVVMTDKLIDKIKVVWFGLCQVGHLYVLSSFGQKLIDHSEYIRESTCATKWYDFPLKMKKLLIIMIMRSEIMLTITAGNLYTMSADNFTTVMKTSMSYFTVLTSMQ